MNSSTCPHGLPRSACEICRILDPTPVTSGRQVGGAPRPRQSRLPGVATVAVVAIVGFVVLGWVAAAVFAVLRIVELVAIAFLAGWVGYRVGLRRGRSGPGRP